MDLILISFSPLVPLSVGQEPVIPYTSITKTQYPQGSPCSGGDLKKKEGIEMGNPGNKLDKNTARLRKHFVGSWRPWFILDNSKADLWQHRERKSLLLPHAPLGAALIQLATIKVRSRNGMRKRSLQRARVYTKWQQHSPSSKA